MADALRKHRRSSDEEADEAMEEADAGIETEEDQL